MSIHRIFNFSAGPAVLPLPVLEEAQRDLLALPGVGMSVMEISHRSKTFEGILTAAEADFRTLARVPADYKVLLLQGGASLQFSMVPMNLLAHGATADYIVTGDWAKKAIKEAQKVGATSTSPPRAKADRYPAIPDAATSCTLTPGAAYVHMTSNNTIDGTSGGRCPTPAPRRSSATPRRTSSARPIDVAQFGLIYAGAQKNLGPSGVTVVIIREDCSRAPRLAAGDVELQGAWPRTIRSTTRRPFGIYILGLVLKWLSAQGGLDGDRPRSTSGRRRNSTPKSIGRGSGGRTPTRTAVRCMNVTFRLPSEELEKRVREGVDGRGARRSEGPSIGRRHARVDLQRVSRGRGGRAGGSSCGSSSASAARPAGSVPCAPLPRRPCAAGVGRRLPASASSPRADRAQAAGVRERRWCLDEPAASARPLPARRRGSPATSARRGTVRGASAPRARAATGA